jgi:hypothetical protein
VYSQGAEGAKDELAITAVNVLRESGVPIKMSGKTRFDEPVERGIIGPVTDSSIDELMSARGVVVGGAPRPGPAPRRCSCSRRRPPYCRSKSASPRTRLCCACCPRT